MKKIAKALSLAALCSTFLFANEDYSHVIEYEKYRISQNPNVQVLDVDVHTKKQLPIEGWYGYILDVKAKIKSGANEKTIDVKDILFSNGQYISLDFIDSKTGKSLKDYVTPNLTSDYHKKEKLIAGNHNAKDKIVIFSDPLCPFCMDYVPKVIEYVNQNKDSIALYYYHFPLLRIHPAAGPLSKVMELAKHKNIKDLELKVYQINWDKHFNSKLANEKVIVEAFNKEFKTNFKVEDLASVSLSQDIKMGEKVMVQGTPTIFVNGEKDNTRLKYQMLGKK